MDSIVSLFSNENPSTEQIVGMSQFSLVAMGGTFDIIHRGHITLLSNAFEISDKVIIGLTSDEFAKKRGKTVSNNYETRLANLTETIFKEFPNSSFQISKLDNDFGPAVLEPEVEALVVSDETSSQGDVLNDLRAQKNLSPVRGHYSSNAFGKRWVSNIYY